MQDKAVRHKCRTATHRAAVQRGFLGIFCTAFCTAFFLSKYFLAVTFCIFYILSFVFLPCICRQIAQQYRKINAFMLIFELWVYGNYNQFSGATRVLLTYTSKCKWLPVLSPVLPTAAIVWPWVTV